MGSVVLFSACSASDSGGGALDRTRTGPPTSSDGTPDGTGMIVDPSLGGTLGGGGTFGPLDDPTATDGTINVDDACVIASAEPTIVRQPVDIILVLDNSGSMADELQAVEDNINLNFASILEASGVDYRVILISRHRKDPRSVTSEASTSICVSAPLSGVTACPDEANPINVPAPVFADRFFQYNLKIESENSLDPAPAASGIGGMLAGYSAPDTRNSTLLAPTGWSAWLRPNAKKVFLEMTDDNASTPVGTFVQELVTRGPEFFGTDVSQPNFVFHSIIGIKEKTAATDAYLPTEPIETERCTGNANSVANAGEAYQALSIMTGGLRFPLCQFTGFDVVFQRIAEDVVVTSNVACDFDIPAPPDGQTLDLQKVAVAVAPGDGSASVQFGQAPTVADCQSNAFFIDAVTSRINLCPDACTAVRSDPLANVDVLFTCQSTIILR